MTKYIRRLGAPFVMGAALVLVGPGAWSIDRRLFGWKRIDVRERSR